MLTWQNGAAYKGLSFAAPSVAQVTGCASAVSSLHTSSCPRAGGQQITIRGLNFGVAGATVLIGAVNCKDVVHGDGSASLAAKHRILTCTLPGGSLASRPVIVFSKNGDISKSNALVSYTPCNEGSYEDDVTFACPLW